MERFPEKVPANEPIIVPAEPIGDTYPREFRGKDGLRYYRVMIRYRRALWVNKSI